jgi:N-acyl-D-amino-acid deacylase
MNFRKAAGLAFSVAILGTMACQKPATYDLILRGGTVYDGSGAEPRQADVAIEKATIAAIGDLSRARASEDIDVRGLAVAPGFINMMSQAGEALLVDGRAQSDIRQGITLEVMGEGVSMGPLSEGMKKEMAGEEGDLRYDVTWTTLDEYLRLLEGRGVSPNVASFIGAANPRMVAIGFEDRPPTQEEMERMRGLVDQAMQEGALGVASALIYPPGSFAQTPELMALAEESAKYGGLYISHIRSEGDDLLSAVQEFLRIAREAKIRAEIFHFKVSGRDNWDKIDQAVEMVNKARAEGLEITADAYPYIAGETGLLAALPPWIQDGGIEAAMARMRDPAARRRIIEDMKKSSRDWENLFQLSGGPEGILLVSFNKESLKPLTGKTLAQVAEIRGRSPEDTAIDLLLEDKCHVGALYFTQSEDIVRKLMVLPWLSFCTDESAYAPEGVFLKAGAHPRAYGTYPRILGKYVRDEKLMSVQEAVRKMAALPAENLRIKGRGRLAQNYFADIVVFDPAKVTDLATYENPHQYSTGVVDVFVNGVQVLRNGEHTGAKPGRVVRGPGWKNQESPER